MNKFIVISPSVCAMSAKKLAIAIGADYENPFKTGNRDYRRYDLVINYGCNYNIKATRLINNAKATACCVDKLRTFTILKGAGEINIPKFTTNAAKAREWGLVVVRKEVDGAGNKGMEYIDPKKNILPDAPLYTEYFQHTKEYRVVVMPVKYGIMSVQAYIKKEKDGNWLLHADNSIHLDAMKAQCIKAAEALNIDYVGFDVIMNKQKQFVILEANSGPILTDDTVEGFKILLKNIT